MTKSLSVLLKDSCTFCVHHFVPLLVASVIFGGATGFIQQKTNALIAESYHSLVHVTPERLQELASRIELGDQTAVEEFMVEMVGTDDRVPENQGEAMKIIGAKFSAMFIAMIPMLFWSFVAISVLQLLLSLYVFQVTIFQLKSSKDALVKTVGSALHFFALALWVFLASFIWIPFFGLFYATYYLPRALYSPMYLLGGHAGVFASVKASFAATKGYWNKITWYTSVSSLLTLLIGFGVSGVLSSIGFYPAIIGGVIGSFLFAYNVVFVVLMGKAFVAEGSK